MPDPAEAYAKAGAAFQGAAWVNDSAYQQSDAVRTAALELLEQHPREKLITPADISNLANSVKHELSVNGVPAAEIEKILARINSSIGAPKSQLADIKSDAQAAVAEATATAHGETVQKSMNAQQQFDAQTRELARLNQEIQKESNVYDSLKTDKEKKDEALRLKEVEAADRNLQAVMADPNATKEQKDAALQRDTEAQKAYHAEVTETAKRVQHDHPDASPEVKHATTTVITKAQEADKQADERKARWAAKDSGVDVEERDSPTNSSVPEIKQQSEQARITSATEVNAANTGELAVQTALPKANIEKAAVRSTF